MGVILETFHSVGTTPDISEALKMQVRCSLMDPAQFFSIVVEIPSGPVEVFAFKELIAWRTSEPSMSSSLSLDSDAHGDPSGAGVG